MDPRARELITIDRRRAVPIEAGETVTLDVDIFYSFDSGGREALVTITVVVTDDNGTLMVGAEQFHGLP